MSECGLTSLKKGINIFLNGVDQRKLAADIVAALLSLQQAMSLKDKPRDGTSAVLFLNARTEAELQTEPELEWRLTDNYLQLCHFLFHSLSLLVFVARV